MAQRTSSAEWLVFGILGFAWGSSYLFIKIGVETLTPLTLVAGRVGIGALVLAAVMLVTRQALPRKASTYGHLVMMALLGIVIPFFLITWGELSISSALAAILTGTVPLLAIVMAALVLVDEPITTNRLVGLLVGFAGVVLVTSPAFAGGLDGSLPGQLALLGASVSYAAAGVYGRLKLRGVPPLTGAFGEVGFAFVISAGLALLLENPLATRVEASTVVSVVWLGLIGSGLAFLAFFYLLNRWGATRTSTVAYLLPAVGVVLGVAVRDEVITPAVLGGMALIIGGVALANLRFGQRRLIGRRAPEHVALPAGK